jgi:bifunctional ADP-heptose synthase (sugar kinase/adenylyltransferase)
MKQNTRPRASLLTEKILTFAYMITRVNQFIEDVRNLRVALVGETIIDEFVSVHYEGHSMKSACPVYKLSESTTEIQQGGTSAIANHLKDFVKEVTLFTNTNREIVKTRYIDQFDHKKHVEINKFDTSGFGEVTIDTNNYDLVIVADFGHGFCDKLNINDGFHLMCQTNSNNFGFNRISKWKNYRKRSVSLDLREASLQMNKNIVDTQSDILELYDYEINSDLLFVTLGSKGSAFCNGVSVGHQQSFPSEIVDTIGAGDTFLAFACLQAAVQPEISELIVPSLAASLSTTWLCNEKSVTQESLRNHAAQFV